MINLYKIILITFGGNRKWTFEYLALSDEGINDAIDKAITKHLSRFTYDTILSSRGLLLETPYELGYKFVE